METIPCRRCFSKVASGNGDDWGNTFRGGKCFACGGTRRERLTVKVAAECRAEAIIRCKAQLDVAAEMVAKGRQAAASNALGALRVLAEEIAASPWWPVDVVARARRAAAVLEAQARIIEGGQ